MEGESPLLKEGALSLQTSLTHRELPPRAPAFSWQRVVSFRMVRVLLGEVFWLDWEARIFCRVRLRTRLVCGVRFVGMPDSSAEIPPAGAPSGFDSAAFVGFRARRCTVVPLRSE